MRKGPLTVGVTGSVGTGKSTVAAMIARRLGGVVIDADKTVHELLGPGTPVTRRIRASFGSGVAGAGGVDRKALARVVFGSRAKLARLNAIVHPAVRKRIRERIRQVRGRDKSAVVVLDIPLLLESGSAYPVDWVVVASAPLGVAARRLKRRSGWGISEIRKRRSFQWPLRKKERLADFVVKNSGTLAATRRQVATLCKQIKENE